MTTAAPNLFFSDKEDVARDAMAVMFDGRGGTGHRLGHFWGAAWFDPAAVWVCRPGSFCLVLQQSPLFL